MADHKLPIEPRGTDAPGTGGPVETRSATASPAAAAPAGAPPEAPQLEQLRGELERAKDRALRCQADLENCRKRAVRDLEEQRRYANLRLLGDLLPVLDNVQRAIEAAEKTADAGSLLQGFKMVASQLETLLAQYNCVKIDALHRQFDPALHEALLQQPSAEHPANVVLQIARQGYTLHDRVVRPTQVIVSREL